MSARNTAGHGNPGTRRRKREQQAKRLRISVQDLTRLQKLVADAGSALQGLTPGERTQRAAARLGLTAPELKDLRRGISGDGPVTERVSSSIRTVLGATAAPSPPPARGDGAKKMTPPPGKGRPVLKAGDYAVFVTKWGQAAHLYSDCRSIDGFRKAHEARPAIYWVAASNPCCRGRRVCGTCSNSSSAQGVKVKAALKKFHGLPFTEDEWSDESWRRVHPPEPPHIRGG
jgi:hypothetical protein